MIELRDVRMVYPGPRGGRVALDALDLTIRSGELVAVVGRSGSGKSTLLNVLAGLDHPTHGTVAVDGVALAGLDETALARWRGRNVGIVFQFFQLIPTMTILENVLLAMDLVKSVPRGEREGRARSLLAEVGIADLANRLPAALSGGEQQRAALARALANRPAVLFADEPTGNLDRDNARAVVDLFRRLAREGTTVMMVTHDRSACREFDRVLTLEDGRLASDERTPLHEEARSA